MFDKTKSIHHIYHIKIHVGDLKYFYHLFLLKNFRITFTTIEQCNAEKLKSILLSNLSFFHISYTDSIIFDADTPTGIRHLLLPNLNSSFIRYLTVSCYSLEVLYQLFQHIPMFKYLKITTSNNFQMIFGAKRRSLVC